MNLDIHYDSRAPSTLTGPGAVHRLDPPLVAPDHCYPEVTATRFTVKIFFALPSLTISVTAAYKISLWKTEAAETGCIAEFTCTPKFTFPLEVVDI